MGLRRKRFHLAGLHRDEVCEALGELARTVEEIGRQVGLERIMRVWAQNRPLRSAENFDADAQHFLASGVQFLDGCAIGLAARFEQGAAADPEPVQRARRFDGESSGKTPG
jgi:hypothetical protein